jgi:hypothetical protein
MINLESFNKWLAVAEDENSTHFQQRGFHEELAGSWVEKI